MWEPKFLDLKSLVKTQLKLNKSHGPFNDKLCALSFDPGTSLTETFLSAVLYLGHSASHSSTQRTLFPMTDNHQGLDTLDDKLDRDRCIERDLRDMDGVGARRVTLG